MLSDPVVLLLVTGAFCAGGVASGSVGMGAGLIAAPLLTMIEPTLVPVSLPVALTWSSAAGWWTERTHTSWPRVGWWVAGSTPGWLVGLWLLSLLSAAQIAVTVGLAGLLFAALIAADLSVPPARGWWLSAGLLGGTGAATVGLNAPFVAPTITGLQPQAARPTLLAYFVIGNVVTIGLWSATGFLGWTGLLAGLLGGPAAAIGVAIGAQLRRWVTRRRFTIVVAGLSAAAALQALHTII